MEDLGELMVNWVQKIKHFYMIDGPWFERYLETIWVLIYHLPQLQKDAQHMRKYVKVRSWKQSQIQAPVTQAKVCQGYSKHKSGDQGHHLEQIPEKETNKSVKHLELQDRGS